MNTNLQWCSPACGTSNTEQGAKSINYNSMPYVAFRDKMTKFKELKQIFTILRKKCPWDRKQTHKTLLKYLKEEAAEFIEAAKSGNDSHMEEELGDVLLQVMFHAQIASEENRFDIEDVIDILIKKLKRRHPHVFGKTKASSVKQVITNWNKIKAKEKKNNTQNTLT